MYSHKTKKRVRYGETDQMGYLYYGHYAQYYEIGRVEMLRSLGMTYKSMEKDLGILMPVMSLQQRFVRPAYYDDELTIETTLRKLPGETITFYVEIFNPDSQLVNAGSVKLCFVEEKSEKTVNCPDQLLERLKPIFDGH
ncbi:MAG: acyl-CoA thioesterase [Saprospiraceae bacterium]|nr:acyl-CoA thioesterase [Saprospiraceae bacterium]